MIFISAQPDDDYFIWQIKVQMNNFRKLGIEKDAIVLFGYDPMKGANPNALKVVDKLKCNVLFFPDRRDSISRSYISTIRPHLLKQFFRKFPNHFQDGFFYHDSDILFQALPKFDSLFKKNKLIVSDTISYIGAKYIKSKGEGLLEEMCNVVGIDPKVVEKNEKKSGGAQYLIPKSLYMGYEFWDKIEKDSVNLYSLMNSTASKYNPSHPIQSWTADMWSVLWNFWLLDVDSLISKELDFSWPTFGVSDWKKYNIFHNAGVTHDRPELFFKGNYVSKSPFGESYDKISDKFCSIKYVEEIIDTAKNFN